MRKSSNIIASSTNRVFVCDHSNVALITCLNYRCLFLEIACRNEVQLMILRELSLKT